ncbi:MAG: glycosyltransferase family 4 protein [bacterium]|nr:glycosyltransferase family 4 protein [bacterium]
MTKQVEKKIILIGPTPPPWGGVAVHVSRMAELLSSKNIDYRVIDPTCGVTASKGLRQISFYRTVLRAKGTVYHFHTMPLLPLWIFMIFLSILRKRVVYTLHDETITDALVAKKLGLIRSFFLKRCLKNISRIVCVSGKSADALAGAGIPGRRIRLLPAFIPQKKSDPATIPQETRKFVNTHKPVLCAYIYTIFSPEGVDTYGVKLQLTMIEHLKKDFPNIGLVLSVPNSKEAGSVRQLTDDMEKRDLAGNINICTTPVDLPALIALCDMYIRPNASDGDSLAVREALFINRPVIASDATDRPSGTILHKSGDAADLEKQVRTVLADLASGKELLQDIPQPDFGERLLTLYSRLMEK